MAKPLNYSVSEQEEIITSICEDVILHKVSFNEAISNSNITPVTFYKWLTKNKELQMLYNYAREIRSDILFEEIIEIADKTEEGVKTKGTPKGMIIETGDMTDHRRLKIDARKWVVSKMNPKKYGDKPDNGLNSDNKIEIEIV